MKRKMLRNGLVAGIIFLFMGISIIPGIKGNIRTIMDTSRDIGIISEVYYDGPAEEWNKTYGGENRDWFRSVMQYDDGSFIIRGDWNHDQSYRGGDGWLLKIDIEGNMIWDKIFGGSDTDFFAGLTHASDGGYMLCFNVIPSGSNNWDNRLAKTDRNFNVEWDIFLGKTNNEVPHSFKNVDDGGYIITGPVLIDDDVDIWLSKMNTDCIEEWYKVYGGDDTDYSNDIIQTADDGFLVIGISESFGAGDRDGLILKIDSNGNEEWNNTFGDRFYDSFQKIIETDDDGYIIIGSTQPYDSDDDIWILKFNSEWNLEWERVIGDRNYNEKGYSIQRTSDAGYIITGVHRSAFITGNQQGIIMKVDSNGYVEWSKLFGGPDDDFGRMILQTSDGGYIVVGETKSYGAGDIDGWIVKFSADDNQRPNKPSRPSGPSSGNANEEYAYATSTIDPDGDQIYYMWNWGDGSYSQWLGPYDSGEECSASHMWTSRGNYEIKVKAKDTNDAESEWSDPLVVSMPKTFSLNILNFLERVKEWFISMFGREILPKIFNL